MKIWLLLVTVLTVRISIAQNLIDSVCTGHEGKIYWVTGSPGSQFFWNIQGVSNVVYLNDTIVVDWGNVPGVYPISVIELSAQNCYGQQVNGDVLVIQTPNINLGADTNICYGNSIFLTPGSGFDSYLWQNGSTVEVFQASSSGIYWVEVTNFLGCSDIDSISLNVNPLPVVDLGNDTVICNFSSFILNAGSGFSYLWSDGSTNQTLNVMNSGLYWVIITDLNGCSNSDSINVTISPPLNASAIINNVTCVNFSNGSIDLSVTGGTAPFSYSWSDGSTLQDLTGLSPGNYSVTITDIFGCSIIANYQIIASDIPILSANVTDALCNNQLNGSIDLSVTGGSSPYNYLWSNSSTSQDLINIFGSVYSITVTDNQGCIVIDTFNVINPGNLTFVFATDNSDCYNTPTGSVDMTVSGGTSPYSFIWSNNTTNEDLINVLAGTYFILVFDANGCMYNSSVTITQPSAITLSSVITSITCNNYSDGAINLSVAGGISPYSFIWSDNSTTEDLSGLVSGNYSVTVYDSNSCTKTASVQIANPAALNASFSIIPVQCNGGSNSSVNLTVSGGTSPYTYIWSNNSTTEDLSALIANTYIVTITDNHNCTLVDSVDVVQPDYPISSSTQVQNVNCFGQASGSINLTVSGGISPYFYHWSNNANTQNLNNIPVGTYSVTITDSNGCKNITSAIVTQPSAALSQSNVITPVSCFGYSTGSINITVNGGTSPYVFHWSNNATTEDVVSLNAANYTLTITDSLSCILTVSYMVSQPNQMSLLYSQVDVACFGNSTGSINLSVIGGTQPYTYIWSNGITTQDLSNLAAGSYSVTVTDNHNCPPKYDTIIIAQPSFPLSLNFNVSNVNCYGGSDGVINITTTGGIQPYSFFWSNNATTEDLIGIGAGSYSITVVDYNNCYITGITQVDQPASALAVTYTISQISCHGIADGEINLTVSGATTPYSYNWSNSETSEDLTGIGAGIFTVTVSDFNSCYFVQTINIVQPLALSLNATVTNVPCSSGLTGAINLTVFGGTSPMTYLWSNGLTSEDISNVPSGTYYVTVTDLNNCEGTGLYMITQPDSTILIAASVTDVNCLTDTSGAVNITVSGGTPDYSYLWNSGETVEDITGLVAGDYLLTVTDNNSCTSTISATVNDADRVYTETVVASNYNNYSVSCFGGSDGIINLNITGGIQPYDILWSNGSINQNLYGVPAGLYTVTVTDINECKSVDTINLLQPAPLVGVNDIINPTCPDFADGSIIITVTGGINPYNYLWSNSDITNAIHQLGAGIYSITVSDANNCLLINEYSLANIYEECIFIPSAFTPNGDGFNDVWNIRGIELYPQTIVEVYNRWGQLLFRSESGYTNRWDGKYNGNDVPTDTYHYVVTLNSDTEAIIGTVTIIR